MAIRAVVERGVIRPLEPVPPEWVEGAEVSVELTDDPPLDAGDNWLQELDELAAAIYDPEDWARIEGTLAEADALAKQQMRREMGLAE